MSNRVLDSGLTFSNVESASPIERSFDQTLLPLCFSACCQAAQQQARNPKNIKSFPASVCRKWTTRCSGNCWSPLGNYFKLLESKEDNQRVPKSSQLSDLKNEQEGANSVAVSRKRLSLNEVLLFTSPNFAWRSMRTETFAVGLPFWPCG